MPVAISLRWLETSARRSIVISSAWRRSCRLRRDRLASTSLFRYPHFGTNCDATFNVSSTEWMRLIRRDARMPRTISTPWHRRVVMEIREGRRA